MSELLRLSASVTWTLDKSATGGPRKFAMLAYTGAIFDLGFGPAMIALDGLETPPTCPIFRDHDASKYVGRAGAIDCTPGGLMISGVLFDTDEGREIALMSDQGAEWQASVGVTFALDDLEFVAAGQSAVVNGQKVNGPLTVLKRSRLFESSFVPLGADSNTHAVALADAVNARLSSMVSVEVKRMADEKKGASIAELRAAFPGQSDFVLSCAEQGMTLLEAKAAYADVVQAESAKKIAELEAKLAQANKPAPAAALGSGSPSTSGKPEESGDPVQDWQIALAAECDRLTKIGWRAPQVSDGLALSAEGALRAAAMNNVASKNPALHQAYLEALNGCEWSRIRREQRKQRSQRVGR